MYKKSRIIITLSMLCNSFYLQTVSEDKNIAAGIAMFALTTIAMTIKARQSHRQNQEKKEEDPAPPHVEKINREYKAPQSYQQQQFVSQEIQKAQTVLINNQIEHNNRVKVFMEVCQHKINRGESTLDQAIERADESIKTNPERNSRVYKDILAQLHALKEQEDCAKIAMKNKHVQKMLDTLNGDSETKMQAPDGQEWTSSDIDISQIFTDSSDLLL